METRAFARKVGMTLAITLCMLSTAGTVDSASVETAKDETCEIRTFRMVHSIVSIDCPLETVEACLIEHNRCDQLCDRAYPDRLTGEDAEANWDAWEACTEECADEWDLCVVESNCNT